MFPHFFSEYHVSLHFHLKEKKMKKFFPALVAVPPTTLYSFCKGYGFADSHKVSGNPSSHILCGNGILLEIWRMGWPIGLAYPIRNGIPIMLESEARNLKK